MLRSVWLSPSPRGEGSFFPIVADVFFVTIPFPEIFILTICVAVMIRFMLWQPMTVEENQAVPALVDKCKDVIEENFRPAGYYIGFNTSVAV